MLRTFLGAAILFGQAQLLAAQEIEKPAPSPNQIVAEASPDEWVAIGPENLLVMTLAPDADGSERTVVIQLMPPPLSQGWVANIRALARAEWYDGISVNRVQDNYVAQWGDPNSDSSENEAKAIPNGLRVMDENSDYTLHQPFPMSQAAFEIALEGAGSDERVVAAVGQLFRRDSYSGGASILFGWPVGIDADEIWPVHCYGMVGVGRGYSPDTGSGSELYAVIGHAPRHLDRNIALVGRVIEGIEHLSALPRGKGALGFYLDPAKRVRIQSIRVSADLPKAQQPQFEYLAAESETFVRYAKTRANRNGPFFIRPAGGADICNIPVPVRRIDKE